MKQSVRNVNKGRFQEGREDVKDAEHPSTSTTDENVEKVKATVMNDRWITIREVADDVGISNGSCNDIFANILGMKRVVEKFVPKLLHLNKNSGEWKLLWNHKMKSTSTQISWKGYIRQGNMDLRIWRRNEGSIFPVEAFWLSKTEKGKCGRT